MHAHNMSRTNFDRECLWLFYSGDNARVKKPDTNFGCIYEEDC